MFLERPICLIYGLVSDGKRTICIALPNFKVNPTLHHCKNVLEVGCFRVQLMVNRSRPGEFRVAHGILTTTGVEFL